MGGHEIWGNRVTELQTLKGTQYTVGKFFFLFCAVFQLTDPTRFARRGINQNKGIRLRPVSRTMN